MATVAKTVENNGTNTLDKKKKKREDRSFQHIMHQVEHLPTAEERLNLACRKYAELYEEVKNFKDKETEFQKKITLLNKEKDHLQSENNKLVLAKDRLETLSRELQKINKAIKEDSAAVARASEERRQEVSATFQTKITEIQAQIAEYHEQNQKLRQENDSLAGKLKEFLEQFEQRAEQMDRTLKAKELEAQLAEAKLKQAKLQLQELEHRHLLEVEKYRADVESFQNRALLQQEVEKKLREQTDFYKDKYDEFHTTLTQSSEVYASCKVEMEKMAKRMKSLEKDTLQWRTKCENSNRSVLQLAQEKMEQEKMIATLNTKVSTLENLCRALRSQIPSSNKSQPPSAAAAASISSLKKPNEDNSLPSQDIANNGSSDVSTTTTIVKNATAEGDESVSSSTKLLSDNDNNALPTDASLLSHGCAHGCDGHHHLAQ